MRQSTLSCCTKIWLHFLVVTFLVIHVDGYTGAQTTLAFCTAWNATTCPITTPPNIIQNYFNPDAQTLCQADVFLSYQQIDWQSTNGGKGHVSSATINGKSILIAPIYPSTAYFAPKYPQCEQWYSSFPPYGNFAPGTGPKYPVLQIAQSNSLELRVVTKWEGSHDSHPVCSMSGISYAMVVRLDFHYEVQELNVCPGWDPLKKTSCSNKGECACSESDGAARICKCFQGFGSPDCSDCADDFFGSTCSQKCLPCLNGGTCNSGVEGNGECRCPSGFDPSTRCSACLPNHFGHTCNPCPLCNYPHGNCVDGINGNGKCACAVGWDPETGCAECRSNFFGPNCSPCPDCGVGTCKHGKFGDGTCVCPKGFDPKFQCKTCLKNFFGPNCTECLPCNGERGKCNDGMTGDGECTCAPGYTTASRCSRCSIGWDYDITTSSCKCSPEHFGPYCLSCPICAPHGRCSDGLEGDGNCICDVGWSPSDNCVGCMNGYYGFNCQSCQHCGHGKCDDGLKGTGGCICSHGWDARKHCLDCAPGYYGINCTPCLQDCGNGECSSGINGSGDCICDHGWEDLESIPCAKCKTGYFGSRCSACPGTLPGGVPCNGHGECVETADGLSVQCSCNPRYSGLSCEQYEFPVAMVGILGIIALATLGMCMCAMRRLAGSSTSSNYKRHMKGDFGNLNYVEINGMTDLEGFVSADSKDWLIPFEALTLQYEVGNGTSGQVFRSLYHSGGGSSTVAVKRLYSPITGQEYFQNFFRREVTILSKLHHPNVVRFYGVSYYGRVLYIVTDFCPASLNDLIETPDAKGPFEEGFFIKIISQIASGMGFLHSRNVVHRDLKPANVLMNDTEDVNICDFGLSRLLDPDTTSMTAEVGTPSYMAPEMATMGGIQCSTKGDVYSFGILLYSTWTRSKPYGDQGMNPFQLMTAVVNGLRPVIPISCPPGLANLMRSCWDANLETRPSFPEISQKLKDPSMLKLPDDVKEISRKSLKTEYIHETQAHMRKKGNKSKISEISKTSGISPNRTPKQYGSIQSNISSNSTRSLRSITENESTDFQSDRADQPDKNETSQDEESPLLSEK